MTCKHEPLLEIDPCPTHPQGVPVSVGMLLPQRVCKRCGSVYVEEHVRKKIARDAKRPARDKLVQRRRYVEDRVLLASIDVVDRALHGPDGGIVERIGRTLGLREKELRIVRDDQAGRGIRRIDELQPAVRLQCVECGGPSTWWRPAVDAPPGEPLRAAFFCDEHKPADEGGV